MDTEDIEQFCSNNFLENHVCDNTDDGFTIAKNRGIPQSTVIIGNQKDIFTALLEASIQCRKKNEREFVLSVSDGGIEIINYKLDTASGEYDPVTMYEIVLYINNSEGKLKVNHLEETI